MPGMGREQVLKTITKGLEVVLKEQRRNHLNSDQEGVAVQKTKPVIKLSDFYLCGKKPVASGETPPEAAKTTPSIG